MTFHRWKKQFGRMEAINECLNRKQLWTLTEARVVIGFYLGKYDQLRPHSRLGYLSPSRFAEHTCPSTASVGLCPPYTVDGQNQNEELTSAKCSD